MRRGQNRNQQWNEKNREQLTGLADTCTTEETNFTTTRVRGQEIEDLNTSTEDIVRGSQFPERRSKAMDGELHLSINGATAIEGFTYMKETCSNV